jgi:CelD/BcsL family acetyltransferase involved in cellulose biosynthesis
MRFELHKKFPEELANQWNTVVTESPYNLPFLKFEYLRLWWESKGAGEWPDDVELFLVTAHEGDLLIGAAPLFKATDGILRFVGSIEITDYLGFIVKPEYIDQFIQGVFQTLSNEKWQSMALQNIFDDAPFIPEIETAALALGWHFNHEPLEVAPSVTLEGDWEAYLSTVKKKQRHEIRRKMRRAETAEQQVQFRLITEEAEIPQAMQNMFTLMRNDDDKVKFLTPQMEEFFLKVALWAHQEKMLNLAFLEIGGQPAACNFSFDYDNQVWLYNSGISTEYNELSPGWVILGNLIQWCTENGKTRFDFMRGDEEYKYRFGAENRHLVQLNIIR